MKTKLLRALAALVLSACAITAAFALNNDQTRIFPQRVLPDQQMTYYRFTLNFNDPNISTGQAFGALPKNAVIQELFCQVTTAFNASSTNLVTLGTTKASANEILAGSGANASITAGSAAIYNALSAAPGLGVNATSAGDVTLYAKYAQTGTAATAGSVTCVIEYVPNNDM